MKEFKQTFDEVYVAKFGKMEVIPEDVLKQLSELWARDGNGTELTESGYDDIEVLKGFVCACLLYRKNGSKQFGLMTNDGKEITPCNLDSYSTTCQTVYFQSGKHHGLWQIETGELLEPIYDNIEIDFPSEATIFTLNGVKGYVKVSDHSFIPQSMKDTMSDDEWHDLLLECIRDQYIDD